MRLKYNFSVLLSILFLSACGGDDSSQLSVSAVSHYVPYLSAAPSVSYVPNEFDPNYYDVTVTLQADGPTGVAFVDLWIQSTSENGDFDHLDLMNIPGTNTWTATSLVPLAADNYYIDSITLDDGDLFTDSVVRTGWYIVNPLGGATYMVDEREVNSSSMEFLFYNSGQSNIGITRFSLP